MSSWRTGGVLLLVVLATGCGWRKGKPDGSGTIECTEVNVAAEVGGRILELPIQEGAAVRRGELVARLDPAGYALRVGEAEAGLAQARAQLDLMLKGSRDEDIERGRAQAREAAAAAWAATQDLSRVTALFAQRNATRKQLDDASAMAERTAAALAAADQTLARLLRGNRQEEVRVAQAAVDLAEARLAQTRKAVADCAVRAPLDGVVTVRAAEPGEVAAPGSTLATLARLDEVWLSIYVPEPHLARVRLGAPARVRVDGAATTWTGRVSFVSPVAEFTPRNAQTAEERAKLVYRVKIAVANPDGTLKPGMPADAYLEDGRGR
jgi:HlyD family secretion protein